MFLALNAYCPRCYSYYRYELDAWYRQPFSLVSSAASRPAADTWYYWSVRLVPRMCAYCHVTGGLVWRNLAVEWHDVELGTGARNPCS